MPGTTRDIIDEEVLIEDQKFLILDTAGIRRKTKVNENVEYYSVNRAIKSIEMSDIVYLVIDSTEEISTQDKKIAGQIINKGKGIIVVLNKWDLANKSNAKIKDKTEMLLFKFPQIDYVPIVPVSSLTGEGIKKLLTATISIFTELQKTVDTSDINRLLQNILTKHAPSGKKGLLKIYYGTQVSRNPVNFIIFINKLTSLSNNYKEYIINQIREKFGYSGIPVEIIFKDKNKEKK